MSTSIPHTPPQRVPANAGSSGPRRWLLVEPWRSGNGAPLRSTAPGEPALPFADLPDLGRMWGHPNDVVILPHLQLTGSWEDTVADVARSILLPGMNVLDVGANVGYFSRLYASLVGPTGGVLAIEANPEMFEVLQRNIAEDGSGTIEGLNVAAGRSRGWVTMDRSQEHQTGNPGANQVVLAEKGNAEVPMVPLDDVLDPDVAISLVKVDIEGFDGEAVAGLERTISRWRPLVIIEWNPKVILFHRIDPYPPLFDYLDRGWEIHVLEIAVDNFRLQWELLRRLQGGSRLTRESVEWMRETRVESYLGSTLLNLLLITGKAPDPMPPPPPAIEPNPSLVWEEVVAAYAAGRLESGLAACEHLLLRDDISPSNRGLLIWDEVFYAPAISSTVPGATALETDAAPWVAGSSQDMEPWDRPVSPTPDGLDWVGGPISSRSGDLRLVVQHCVGSDESRATLHRFARLNGTGVVDRLTAPFRFVEGAEVTASGLELVGDNVLARLERDTGETAVASIPLSGIERWLEASDPGVAALAPESPAP